MKQSYRLRGCLISEVGEMSKHVQGLELTFK